MNAATAFVSPTGSPDDRFIGVRYFRELTDQMSRVHSDTELEQLHHWVWQHRMEMDDAIAKANAELELTGAHALKPDLPSFSVGRSRSHLLVMGANPGWDEKRNAKEEAYFRDSAQRYWEFSREYFGNFRRVVGPSPYWTKAIKYAWLLPGQSESIAPTVENTDALWKWADRSGMVGAWELIPFHSARDGVTPRTRSTSWLHELAKASIYAALRFEPALLLAPGKELYSLVRNDLLSKRCWLDDTAGSGGPQVLVSYTKQDGSEIVTINRQIFSGRAVSPRKEIIFDTIMRLRSRWEKECG